jgi:transposase
LLSGQPGPHGGIADENRGFIDAVLSMAKTGASWRDLPERLSNWNSQWRRFDRWAAQGRWGPILAVWRDPDSKWLILDSTVARAHPCAAESKKVGWQQRPAGAGSGPQPGRVRHQNPRRFQPARTPRGVDSDGDAGSDIKQGETLSYASLLAKQNRRIVLAQTPEFLVNRKL